MPWTSSRKTGCNVGAHCVRPSPAADSTAGRTQCAPTKPSSSTTPSRGLPEWMRSGCSGYRISLNREPRTGNSELFLFATGRIDHFSGRNDQDHSAENDLRRQLHRRVSSDSASRIVQGTMRRRSPLSRGKSFGWSRVRREAGTQTRTLFFRGKSFAAGWRGRRPPPPTVPDGDWLSAPFEHSLRTTLDDGLS